MDHNVWFGVGRLTRNPEYFPPGRKGEAHVKFTLAVNRVVSNQDGPQADYIPCVLWGNDLCKDFVEKRSQGDTVGVVGRFRTAYVLRPGGKREFFFEVRIDEVYYGMKSLRNLQGRPPQDKATHAVKQLREEFAGNE